MRPCRRQDRLKSRLKIKSPRNINIQTVPAQGGTALPCLTTGNGAALFNTIAFC